jgi:hypothetical protein
MSFQLSVASAGTLNEKPAVPIEFFHGLVFAFHDGAEIGPRMLARIAKKTGLNTTDL